MKKDFFEIGKKTHVLILWNWNVLHELFNSEEIQASVHSICGPETIRTKYRTNLWPSRVTSWNESDRNASMQASKLLHLFVLSNRVAAFIYHFYCHLTRWISSFQTWAKNSCFPCFGGSYLTKFWHKGREKSFFFAFSAIKMTTETTTIDSWIAPLLKLPFQKRTYSEVWLHESQWDGGYALAPFTSPTRSFFFLLHLAIDVISFRNLLAINSLRNNCAKFACFFGLIHLLLPLTAWFHGSSKMRNASSS